MSFLRNVQIVLWIATIAAILWLGFAVRGWVGNGRYQIVFVLDTPRYIARLDTKTGKIEPFFMPDDRFEIISFKEYAEKSKELKKSGFSFVPVPGKEKGEKVPQGK